MSAHSQVVVRAGLVVTMDGERRMIRDGAVAVADGRITAVGPASEVLRDVGADAGRGRDVPGDEQAGPRGPGPDSGSGGTQAGAAPPGTASGSGPGRRRLEVHHVPDGVIMPGMVDAHQHLTGDRLVRSSIPDDISSNEAIFSWAVPVHETHNADDDELSATLAAVEAACNGVTAIVEAGTVAHPERVAAGVGAVGLRATIGTWGWDADGVPFAGSTDEVLARQAAVLDRFPPGGLVTGWVTLVGHDLMSDELLVGASELARQQGTGLTFHISPHDRDAEAWLARSGRRPLVHFDELGALGPHVLLAHAVHLDNAEVDVVLNRRVAVASCPWAYLRLAQGMATAARHWELAERGGRLALGCDSENAGDQIDVLRAAALFAGLGKDARRDPSAPGAHTALELATVRGAEAVGLGDVTGALAPGLSADLVVLDGTRPEWTPPGADPALQLVWGTDGRAVQDVMVAGRWVVRGRQPTGVDLAALRTAARDAQAALVARSGIRPRPRWPLT
ncbi:MAG: amidohydrolase family protein [Acidimicrobiales bacterium]